MKPQLSKYLFFLGAVWYTCNQLAYSEVFESQWYLKHFFEVLPGFPVEYCYGIIANPVTEYAMEVKDKTPLFKRFINRNKLTIKKTSKYS